MTFRAVTNGFDEIATAIPTLRPPRLRFDRRRMEKQELPQSDAPTNFEGESQFVIRRSIRDRRQGPQERHEIAYIVNAHAGVASVGQRWIQVLSGRRDPA